MKKTLIAVVLSAACALSSLAAESNTQPKKEGQSIEQKKIEILQRIDERISLSQEEKLCVQAAQSRSDLDACREKFRPKRKDDGQDKR